MDCEAERMDYNWHYVLVVNRLMLCNLLALCLDVFLKYLLIVNKHCTTLQINEKKVKTYVIDLIKTAILYYEPRIDVNKISIDPTNELEGELLINIEYTVRTTNSRKNMVFPFYKSEGSEL